MLAFHLVPFAVAIAVVQLQAKIWLDKAPKGASVEKHGAPIAAHVGTQIAGKSSRLHCLGTLDGQLVV